VPSSSILKQVVAPKKIENLFSTMILGLGTTIYKPALVPPFDAVDADSTISMCRFGDADNWQQAIDTINRQLAMVGGRVSIGGSKSCGDAPGGLKVYKTKTFQCECAGKHRPEKREDRLGASIRRTCESIKVRALSA
jgi:hypothetical protein